MTTATFDHSRVREIGIALLLFAATVALSLALAAPHPASRGSVVGSSIASGIGTLAIAYYLARRTPFPRWGFLAAAWVLALGAIASGLAFPDPGVWLIDVRPVLWLQPWFFLVMAWTPSGANARWPAPGTPRPGLGVSALGVAFIGVTAAAALFSKFL